MKEEKYSWHDIKDNKEKLSKLFTDFYDDLFLYAKRFEKDEDTIKDLIQELFLKLWKNRNSLNPGENIKAYLFRSLRNIWNNNYKVNQRMLKCELPPEGPFVYQPEDFKANNENSL